MYKLFLTLRYLRKRRIAIFAVVSVWLCVAMEVIVISVMGGFLDTLRERSRGLLSDLIIDNQMLQGFPYYQEFMDHMKTDLADVVESATPVIYNYGLLRVDETSFTKPVQVVGIRLREYVSVNDFENSLYYDKYYPGTTTLGIQRMPVVGYDDSGVPRLPESFERALAEWEQAHPDAPELDEWKSSPGGMFRGPGAFETAWDRSPGYFTGDEAAGVIVGCNIINERLRNGQFQRVFPRGQKIILSLIPLTRTGKISGEGATTVVARLADDSRTRVFEIDNTCCYVDFEHLQKWLSMNATELEDGRRAPARASQVLVALKPGFDIQKGRSLVESEWNRFASKVDIVDPNDAQFLSSVKVETWEERQIQFIAAVEKEKILVTLLFGVISLVAVVLIGCIFWMIVTQKTRDIGIVKSFGASSRGVAMIFVSFGVAVGVLGAFLGSVSGAVFVWYINDIQDFLVSIHPQLRVWSPDVYTFDTIPNTVKINEVLVICAVAVVASVLGALIPAVIAGRVWPVKALRYE